VFGVLGAEVEDSGDASGRVWGIEGGGDGDVFAKTISLTLRLEGFLGVWPEASRTVTHMSLESCGIRDMDIYDSQYTIKQVVVLMAMPQIMENLLESVMLMVVMEMFFRVLAA